MKTKSVLAAGGIAILVIALAGFAWIWVAPCELGGCAPLDDLAEYQVEGSEILDMNGDPFARLATVNRQIVSLDSLPAYLPQAFVAIEDQRFYSHGGVDLWRTGGALIENIREGGVAEGGEHHHPAACTEPLSGLASVHGSQPEAEGHGGASRAPDRKELRQG